MRAEGVVTGDRVVAWVPNVTETVIYALGALSIGAVVSTASPDFAPHAVEDRFGQVEPKIFLAADGYNYNGKYFDCSENQQRLKSFYQLSKRPCESVNLMSGSNHSLVLQQITNNYLLITPVLCCSHRAPQVSQSALLTAVQV